MLGREKIGQGILKFINVIYIFFMIWTLLGAIRSSKLELNNVSNTGIGIIVIGVLIYLISKYTKLKVILNKIISKCNSIKVAVFLSCLVVILQLLFVLYTHPKIGFDLYHIYNAIIGNVDISYFSHCTNNLPILLIQKFICNIFHNISWLLLDIVTIFLVDVSALFNLCTISLVNKKYLISGIYVHLMWLLLFPMIIVPYTDTWVLPFVSLFILMWVLISKKNLNYSLKIMCSIIMGIAIIGAYFIKPSSIIAVIAIVIVELIKWIFFGNLGEITIKSIGILFFVCISSTVFFWGTESLINNQKYIPIEAKKSIPPIHFVAMGMIGQGGYNSADAEEMFMAKDTQEMKEISKKKIKERIEEKGILGYIKFLLYKQNMNTADGTFGWNAEGQFLNQKMPKKGIKRKIAEYIYPEGEKIHDFFFVAQIWWISWLFILLFGFKKSNDKVVQMTRLAIIGGMIFLLLFEGGRSRYLIQFLPSFLILCTLQLENVKARIKMWLLY